MWLSPPKKMAVAVGTPGKQGGVGLVKPDRQALRIYMKEGYKKDVVCVKLERKWKNYDTAKRMAYLRKLKLPPSVLQCCAGSECDNAALRDIFATMCVKKTVYSALVFLFAERNKVYLLNKNAPVVSDGL